jgi:hypothetical protein
VVNRDGGDSDRGEEAGGEEGGSDSSQCDEWNQTSEHISLRLAAGSAGRDGGTDAVPDGMSVTG